MSSRGKWWLTGTIVALAIAAAAGYLRTGEQPDHWRRARHLKVVAD